MQLNPEMLTSLSIGKTNVNIKTQENVRKTTKTQGSILVSNRENKCQNTKTVMKNEKNTGNLFHKCRLYYMYYIVFNQQAAMGVRLAMFVYGHVDHIFIRMFYVFVQQAAMGVRFAMFVYGHVDHIFNISKYRITSQSAVHILIIFNLIIIWKHIFASTQS